jgi:2-dehydropantoate 2-reductase
MIKNVTIAGLGALGGLMADKLAAAGIPVSAVADPARVARYREGGVYANGRRLDVAYLTPDQAQPVDLLLFACKYTGLDQTIEEARAACGPDTIVMSLLNGVTSEEMIAQKLAPAHLLYTTAQGMATGKIGNQITYYSDGSLTFGTRQGLENADTAAVAALMDKIGFRYEIAPDMMRRLYSKWMLNCGVNQTCAVYEVGYGGVQPGGKYRAKMIAAMEEARLVATAAGYPLSLEERDQWVAVIDSLDPQGEPSMRQDAKAGRPTEVGLFGETVCRLGRECGIATPVNAAYAAILTARQK